MQLTAIMLLHYAIINVIISCNVINVEQCTIIVLLSSIYMWVHKDYEQNVTTFCTDKLITIWSAAVWLYAEENMKSLSSCQSLLPGLNLEGIPFVSELTMHKKCNVGLVRRIAMHPLNGVL